MKKSILLLAVICLSAVSNLNAQIDLGLRAGLNYDFTGDATGLATGVSADTKTASGYHFGGFMKVQIPVVGIFAQAELLYTSMSGDIELKNSRGTKVSLDNQVSRIDVPLLVGKEFLSLIKVYAGPVISYNLNNDSSIPKKDLPNLAVKDLKNMAIAGMIGVGVDFMGVYADLRYDFGLGDQATEFVNKQIDGTVKPSFEIPNRTSQIILSVGYAFL